jgi:hypothetical protein
MSLPTWRLMNCLPGNLPWMCAALAANNAKDANISFIETIKVFLEKSISCFTLAFFALFAAKVTLL